MSEVASAFVTLVPSAKGFGVSAASAIGPQMGGAGKKAGLIFGAALGVAAAGALAAAGIGKALYEVGQVFDDMSDTIAVGTGASGKALEKLNQVAENVGRSTPSSFEDIGTAIADLHSRLDLTGGPLEEMASRVLNLSRLTGTDLKQNIADVTRVFGDWGIQMKDQPKALDEIFRASQLTGTGINDLAQNVVQMGAPLRQFGFSFEEGLAIFGKWEKEGVNTRTVMSGLKIGLGAFSKAGKDPQKALEQVTEAIKNAGSAGKANELAIKTFGQRAGPDMAAAIREGRFAIDDLVKKINNSGGALTKADQGTRDFSESWQVFKNNVLIGLKPLAEKVFQGVTDAAVVAFPKILAAFSAVQAYFAGPGGDTLRAFAAQASDALRNQLVPALQRLATFVVGTVIPALQQWWSYLATKVIPAVRDALVPVLASAKRAFNSVRQTVKENGPELRQLFSAFKQVANFILTKLIPATMQTARITLPLLGGAIKVLINVASFWVNAFNAARATVNAVRTAVEKAGSTLKQVANKIINAFKGLPKQLTRIGGQIIDGLVNGIKAAAHKVADAVKAIVDKIPGKIKDIMGISSPSKVTHILGLAITQGLVTGLEAGKKKVIDKVSEVIGKVKDKLSSAKDAFGGLVDPIASAFTGDLFSGATASQFVSNLLGTKGQLTGLVDAFKTLIGQGLNPKFLYDLFQSGNAGLILDLAKNPALATQAGGLFGEINALSNQLGTAVAGATPEGKDLLNEVKHMHHEQKETNKLLADLPPKIANALNRPAAHARRRARAA